jgi:hypothetical protein
MEITKQNETFNVSDTLEDGTVINGSATKGNDTTSVSLTFMDGYYNVNVDSNDRLNVNYSINKDNEEKFVEIAKSSASEVLTKI